MRQTYVAAAQSQQPGDKRSRRQKSSQSRSTIASVVVAVVLDSGAIAFTAVLLWLGAGTTVLSGEPVAMSLAFGGGAVLAALSNLRMGRAETRGAVSIALVYALLLAAAYALRIIVVQTYFFSWVLVYAGAFIAARATVALVIDAFAGRARSALTWRFIAIAAGTTVILLLSNVWSDSALLVDLIVFVFLLSVTAVLIELGFRSFRKSRDIAS